VSTFTASLSTIGTVGADWLIGASGNDTLSAGAGNDRLQGDVGNDVLNGEDGNDILEGHLGNDTLNGGSGNDQYVLTMGQGSDIIADSSGANDVLELQYSNTPFGLYRDGTSLKIRGSGTDVTTVSNFWSTTTGSIAGTGYIETIELKNIVRNEVTTYKTSLSLTGTTGADWIVGTLSNDSLSGDAGHDRLQGDAGNDVLNAGEGNDVLAGGIGNDSLDGGVGNDWADYQRATGSVTVNLSTGLSDGADGKDTLKNIEYVMGSAFNDTLIGNAEQNFLRGGRGNDSLDGGAGFDWVDYQGSSGSVTVNLLTGLSSGADGIDTLLSIERIRGGDFDDTLIGNASNNYLRGGLGNDSLDGGAGDIDWADYLGASGSVTVNLLSGLSSGADGIDTIVNIERIRGGDFDDTLIGNASKNYLRGGLGNDSLDGGAGNDDMVDYSNATGSVFVNLATGVSYGADGVDTIVNIERIQGSNFDDTLIGNAGGNDLRGGLGNDTLDGGEGRDGADYTTAIASVIVNLSTGTSSGADGVDTLVNIENIGGSEFNDTLTGNAENNWLHGNLGDDSLDGGAGSDYLWGQAGNDTLNGGDGGSDWAAYDGATGAVAVNLATGKSTGADGNDTLLNIEHIRGGAFNDTLTGDAGNNYLVGGLGNDSLDGGAGTDWVQYQYTATGAVTVNLTTGITSGEEGVDTIVNIENIDGSNFNDTLIGNAENNGLYGNLGDDYLDGGSGNDWLEGGSGNDRYVLLLGQGSDNITDSAGLSDSLELQMTNASGFGLYRDGTSLKIRGSGADVSTVNNFWSATTGNTAGTGYIESIQLKNISTNEVLTFTP
jgi:Ca2+-binding RTX toxin-like protein